jgi:hypothetical protein
METLTSSEEVDFGTGLVDWVFSPNFPSLQAAQGMEGNTFSQS